MTPLHFAARARYSNVLKVILQAKACVDCRNNNGSTALHLACERGTKATKGEIFEVMVSLIYHEADIDAKDNNQMTPLHVASRDNCTTIVEILLKCGADRSSRDADLNLPFHYAALNGHYDVILMLHLLSKKYNIIDTSQNLYANINNETPLFLASREGHTKVVALLLQIGFEILRPDFKGRTALHRSAGNGHLETVKLLRQALLNKDKEDKWGFTALNYAASWKGHQEVIGYLSSTQLNITSSYYLRKSNPFQPNLEKQASISVQKLPGIRYIPYSFEVDRYF